MPRSTITALPDELQATIRQMVQDGGYTYDQIHAHVRALGADVSRTAIARFGKAFLDHQRELETARDMARELLALGDGQELAELVSRLVAVKLLAILLQNDVVLDDDLGLGHLIAIARACVALQGVAVARDRYRAECEALALDVQDRAARGGLQPDTIEVIKRRILGLGEGGA